MFDQVKGLGFVKICSYTVNTDKGLAPNPFWAFCTLALCTPNHMGIRAEKDNWIIGTTTAKRGSKLLYAMQLTEDRLHFDDYFADPRFDKKKPIMSGNWMQRCGDNIYYEEGDVWKHLLFPYHYGEDDLKKDTKYPYVFISTNFYYFGRKAVEIPEEYSQIVWTRHGCKWHNSDLGNHFIDWLQESFGPGIQGEPYDKEIVHCKSSCQIKKWYNKSFKTDVKGWGLLNAAQLHSNFFGEKNEAIYVVRARL